MSLREHLAGKRVYFDTNIFIYLLEGHAGLRKQIAEVQDLIETEACTVFTSDLVFTEILPPLVRSGNIKASEALLQFLQEERAFQLVPLSREVCIQAGVLRGQTGMKAPDALHVACAMAVECQVFLTNDLGIQLPKGIERGVFSEF